MENVAVVVNQLLSRLGAAREMLEDAAPVEIVIDSLDQMRFLLGLEDRWKSSSTGWSCCRST